MVRKTIVRAASVAVLSATGFLAVNAACSPMPVQSDCRDKLGGTLNGDWILASINGDPIPAPDPTQPGRVITSGKLNMFTSTVYGSCDPPVESSGTAFGAVTYSQAGSNQGRQSSAYFYAFHQSADVELRAAEGTAKGKFTSTTMIFTNISDARFVLANKGQATLVFSRP